MRLGLLVLVLGVGATSWPVVAQTPQPDDGLMVEVPGFPLRFEVPSTWEVSDPLDRLPYPRAPGSGFHMVVTVRAKDTTSDAGCSLTASMRVADSGPVPITDETRRAHADADDFESYSSWAEVRLPLGPATRWDARAYDLQATWYLVSDGVNLYALVCGASEAPTDRWHSVASTLERRPVAEHATLSMLDKGQFHPSGSLNQPRIGHAAALLADGRAMVTGGSNEAEGQLFSTEVWNPTTGEFTYSGSLREGRGGHTMTVLPDGRVLVIGGEGGADGERLASAEVWDPATGGFSPAGIASEARTGHTATLLPDGRVLVVGGGTGWNEALGCRPPLASAEVWDPATSEFSPAGTLQAARELHTAIRLDDGRVMVVAGEDWCEDRAKEGYEQTVRAVEVWDPASDGFVKVGKWLGPRWDQMTTVLADGRVMASGGLTDEGRPMEVRVWDPVLGEAAPAGTPIEGRFNGSVTVTPDGHVLMVGGSNSGSPGTSDLSTYAEVWDPVTEESRLTGSMAAPRALQTAAALSDGRVLVVGGFNRDGYIAQAEVWEPGE